MERRLRRAPPVPVPLGRRFGPLPELRRHPAGSGDRGQARGSGDPDSSRSRSSSRSPSACSRIRAPIAVRVNWVPVSPAHSASAASGDLAGRYARPDLIASQASATASSAAPSGISMAFSPRGSPGHPGAGGESGSSPPARGRARPPRSAQPARRARPRARVRPPSASARRPAAVRVAHLAHIVHQRGLAKHRAPLRRPAGGAGQLGRQGGHALGMSSGRRVLGIDRA